MSKRVSNAIKETCAAIRALPKSDAPPQFFDKHDIDRGRYDATRPIRDELSKVISFLTRFESKTPKELSHAPIPVIKSLLADLGTVVGIAREVPDKCRRLPTRTPAVVPPSYSDSEIAEKTASVDAAYGRIYSNLDFLSPDENTLPANAGSPQPNLPNEKRLEPIPVDIWDPLSALKEAVRAVPAMKYALAVLGVIAVVAITLAWEIDRYVAIFGAVIVLILMVTVLVFARLSVLAHRYFVLPALVLMWTFVLVVAATAVTLFSAAAFRRPQALYELIFDRKITRVETPPKPLGATPKPNPIVQGEEASQGTTNAIVEEGALKLKAGDWSGAVESFENALRLTPTSEEANKALWRALSEQSDGDFPLPDRAYVWPEGAQLVSMAQNAPLVLALENKNADCGGKASFIVYNYESQRRFSVCNAPAAPDRPVGADFVCDDRFLLIWVTNSLPRLFQFNDSGAWAGPSFPNGWKPRLSRLGGDLLLENKSQFRWWNAASSAWSDSVIVQIPDVDVTLGSDAKGHYFVYSDSKTHRAHIYDLITRKQVCEPLQQPYFSAPFFLSANGQVFASRQSSLVDNVRRTLQQLFTLWILPELDRNSYMQGVISRSGDFTLEFTHRTDQSSDVLVRQREPNQLYQIHRQSKPVPAYRWRLHPNRDELYFQADRSLCVYALPAMLYFPPGTAPAFPHKPSGKAIHRFLRLTRHETAVNLCRERDELHEALVADEMLPTEKKHFADLPQEWRKLLGWWTSKPGQRKSWP